MKEILLLSAKGIAGVLALTLFYLWDMATRLYEAYGTAAREAAGKIGAQIQPHLPQISELLRIKELNCAGSTCMVTQIIVPLFVVLASWVLFFGALFLLRRLMGAQGDRPLLLNLLVLAVLLASPTAVFDVSRDVAALRAQTKALAEATAQKL